jgi:hypothetical protein
MFATKFRFIWVSDFRGEHFLEIDQSETRIACSFGKAVSEEKIITKSTTKKQELPLTAMFVNESVRYEQVL